MKNDLFHIILDFLYKHPLDGSAYDLRKCLSGKLNLSDGERPAYEKIQKVLNFLVEKKLIEFNQVPIKDTTTGVTHRVKVKYGEDPTSLNSEEANFSTTYPMASLTLDGHNYVTNRNKELQKNRIYILTFCVALATLISTILSLVFKPCL